MSLLATAAALSIMTSSQACGDDACHVIYDPLRGDGYYLIWFEKV